EYGALGAKAIAPEFVVNDFVAHVTRRAVLLERPLDDLDGAHDACTKSSRLRENDLDRPARLLVARGRARRTFANGSGFGADGLGLAGAITNCLRRTRL